MKFKQLARPGPCLCILCDNTLDVSRDLLCSACAADLPVIMDACPLCALPDSYNQPCPACIRSAPAYYRARVLYRYEYPVSRLIQQMKFRFRLDIARLLGQQMAARISADRSTPDCLIPVPLHARRLAERGFNQAQEIANSISGLLEIPVESGCARRIIFTRAQTELTAKQRKRNVRGAFALTGPVSPAYRHVAIIDDVVTTGATVSTLAQLLRGSGVARVDVWAAARANV